MENTNWDQRRDDELAQHSAHDAAPQNDWQNAESKASPNNTAEEFISEDASRNTTEDDEHVHAMAGFDDPDEDEEADTE